jgi:guanylate kinase
VKNLFLVDGAAGVGKSDMLSYLASNYSGRYLHIFRKFTTRAPRPIEKGTLPLDLIHIEDERFREAAAEGSYRYGGVDYGFRKADLDSAIETYLNIFVVVRNRLLLRVLRHDYRAAARVVSVLVYSDRELIAQRLNEEAVQRIGNTDKANELARKEIERRTKRTRDVWRDYLRDPYLYDEVIINAFTRANYELLIERLLDKYSDHNLPAPAR